MFTHKRLVACLIVIAGLSFGGATTLAVDSDGDGMDDSVDNCPTVFNPPHTVATDCNSDGDTTDLGEAVGAQCDQDTDYVGDECDNCPTNYNPPHSSATDCNGDGDTTDPNEAAGMQCDQDDDGIGDECDDSDGDGVVDLSLIHI